MASIFSKIQQLFAYTFAIIWIGIILLFYLWHHKYYFDSWQHFQYTSLLIGLGFGSVLIYVLINFPEKIGINFKYPLTGLGLWVGILVLSILTYIYQYFYAVEGYELSLIGLMNFVAQLVWIQANLFLIVTLCFCLGNFCYQHLKSLRGNGSQQTKNELKDPILYLIQIGLGIISLTFILMILGAFSLLNKIILLPFGLILSAIFRKEALHFIKIILRTPIGLKNKISPLGAGSFVFLLFWLIINFISILRPIPFGYDAMTLYVQLPALINDYASLVQGNQPYYWSLFMSLGYLVFGQTEMVLGLSFLGGILSLIALFALFRKWLDVNTTAFCLLLFYSFPSINFLAYQDMKIDLGLLFFLLCIVLLLVNWMEKETANVNTSSSAVASPIILLGIFTGFALGIKLTALFMVFSVLSLFAYYYFSFLGLLTAFSLIFCSIFLLNLNQLNGLQSAFIGQAYIKWGLLFLGVVLSIYLYFKKKKSTCNLLKISILYVFFTGLIFLPWPIKNIIETGEFSYHRLIYGQTKSPQLDIIEMEEKWKAQYE